MSPQQASDCARARVQGMKIRAKLDPPRAATGGFPYPARTCAEWHRADGLCGYRPLRPAERIYTDLPPDATFAKRRQDAIEGSAKLKAAIEAAMKVMAA